MLANSLSLWDSMVMHYHLLQSSFSTCLLFQEQLAQLFECIKYRVNHIICCFKCLTFIYVLFIYVCQLISLLEYIHLNIYIFIQSSSFSIFIRKKKVLSPYTKGYLPKLYSYRLSKAYIFYSYFKSFLFLCLRKGCM